MTLPTGKAKGRTSTRSAARLAAVQALYQMDLAGIGTTAALADMHRRDHPVSGYRYDVGIRVQLARPTGEAVGILVDNECYP